MKNNKKTLLLLIPLLVLVWGGIAYQIFSGLSPSEQSGESAPIQIKKVESVQDTTSYTLYLDYEDPFRVSHTRTSRSVVYGKEDRPRTKPSLQNNKVNNIKKEGTPWPSVEYGGIVKSSNKKEVGLLTVNGKSYLVKKAQVVEELTILSFTEHEIEVKFSGEKKIITK